MSGSMRIAARGPSRWEKNPMRWKGILVVVVGALACLAIGLIWTVRLDVPSPTPWWFGKRVDVQVEVWEPGRDMATFGMALPKGALDAMYALGLKGTIDLNDDHEIELRGIWRQLQRLPRGEKLKFKDQGATILMWIEERREKSGHRD